jgi:hypothetical protein
MLLTSTYPLASPLTFPMAHASGHQFSPDLFMLTFHAVTFSAFGFYDRPYGLPVRYQELFRRFENIMISFNGRPHWAKPHHLGPAQLRHLYPHFDDFVNVVETVDPTGLFRNPNVRRHIFGEQGPSVDERIFKQYKS